ncbi:MAG TPA: hypothetical protein VF669_04470 [Tepidisphaeraceae bacterium]|jgi:DNA-binding response OmpR family regulator
MRLLLVDLDVKLLDVLQSNLSFLGYTVDVCDSGAVAMGLMEKSLYTVVLAGDELSDMSGVELVRKVRSGARTHGQYLILMPREGGRGFEGELARPDAVMVKPFSMSDVIAALLTAERRMFEMPVSAVAA